MCWLTRGRPRTTGGCASNMDEAAWHWPTSTVATLFILLGQTIDVYVNEVTALYVAQSLAWQRILETARARDQERVQLKKGVQMKNGSSKNHIASAAADVYDT